MFVDLAPRISNELTLGEKEIFLVLSYVFYLLPLGAIAPVYIYGCKETNRFFFDNQTQFGESYSVFRPLSERETCIDYPRFTVAFFGPIGILLFPLLILSCLRFKILALFYLFLSFAQSVLFSFTNLHFISITLSVWSPFIAVCYIIGNFLNHLAYGNSFESDRLLRHLIKKYGVNFGLHKTTVEIVETKGEKEYNGAEMALKTPA